MNRRCVIFTDLDGTLLDSRSYSFREAERALERIREQGIPLVLVSSKTRVEIEVYRSRLGNEHPFISENGGGAFVPVKYFPFPVAGEEQGSYVVQLLGIPYRESRRRIIELRERTGINVRGFGDLSAAEVSALTGLTVEEAVLAKQRDFSEPFIFTGEPDERFLRAIENAGLFWTRGRLFHLMGDHDKGKAVASMIALYDRHFGPVTTIGLGDGMNDLPFLRIVDRPVLIRREDGSHEPQVDVPGIIRTSGSGPAGWNEAVLQLIDRLDA